MADLSQARTRVGVGGASLRVTSAAQFSGKQESQGGLPAMLGRYERKRKRRPRQRPH